MLKKRAKKRVIDEKLKSLDRDFSDEDRISKVVIVALGLMVIKKHGSKRLKKKVLGEFGE